MAVWDPLCTCGKPVDVARIRAAIAFASNNVCLGCTNRWLMIRYCKISIESAGEPPVYFASRLDETALAT